MNIAECLHNGEWKRITAGLKCLDCDTVWPMENLFGKPETEATFHTAMQEVVKTFARKALVQLERSPGHCAQFLAKIVIDMSKKSEEDEKPPIIQ